jgi:opacity protein-like surface antigen
MLKRKLLVLGLLAVLFAPAAMAQPDKSWKSWFGDFSGGWVSPEGSLDEEFDSGWNIAGGAMFKPVEYPVGLFAELAYNTMDMKTSAANSQGVNSGDMDIWSLTGGIIYSTPGRVSFFIEAGIGWYNIQVDLKEPGVGCQPPFHGWGWWAPGGCFPTDVVTGRVTTTKFGYNLSLRVAFRFGSGNELYLEAKYHYVTTTWGEMDVATEFLPINIGFRW